MNATWECGRLCHWVLIVTLNALFVFVSVFDTVVWLLKLCTILGSLVVYVTIIGLVFCSRYVFTYFSFYSKLVRTAITLNVGWTYNENDMHNKFRHHIWTFVRQIVKPLSVTQLNFVFVIRICSTSPLPCSKKVKNLMVRRLQKWSIQKQIILL